LNNEGLCVTLAIMENETTLLIKRIKELEDENLSLKKQQVEISEAKEAGQRVFTRTILTFAYKHMLQHLIKESLF